MHANPYCTHCTLYTMSYYFYAVMINDLNLFDVNMFTNHSGYHRYNVYSYNICYSVHTCTHTTSLLQIQYNNIIVNIVNIFPGSAE